MNQRISIYGLHPNNIFVHLNGISLPLTLACYIAFASYKMIELKDSGGEHFDDEKEREKCNHNEFNQYSTMMIQMCIILVSFGTTATRQCRNKYKRM